MVNRIQSDGARQLVSHGSPAKVAKLVGCACSVISELRSGRQARPSLALAERLESVLHIPRVAWTTFTPPASAEGPVTQAGLLAHALAHLRAVMADVRFIGHRADAIRCASGMLSAYEATLKPRTPKLLKAEAAISMAQARQALELAEAKTLAHHGESIRGA